ncbi:hypothetical protein D3C77_669910 [compost metagenome]
MVPLKRPSSIAGRKRWRRLSLAKLLTRLAAPMVKNEYATVAMLAALKYAMLARRITSGNCRPPSSALW